MAPIQSVPKPKFQECYKELQGMMECLLKINIMDENDPEYKVMYVKYHETLQKFMENQPMLPKIPNIKEICHIDNCDGIVVKDEKYCLSHICKWSYTAPYSIELQHTGVYSCSNATVIGKEYCKEHNGTDYCENHKDKSEIQLDDFVVVPKIPSDDSELDITKVVCGFDECEGHPVLKSHDFCKEHKCGTDKCNDSIIFINYSNNRIPVGKFCEKHSREKGPFCIVCKECVVNCGITYGKIIPNMTENLHYKCACEVLSCPNPKENNGFCEKHKDFAC